jgi:hypothetical protein
MLLRVDQDRGRFFYNGMIVGPLHQDLAGGVRQIDLDPLVCRKIECNQPLGLIRQCQFDRQLAHLREFYGLRSYLKIECETAQSGIFVLRNWLVRKWMENASQPTAFVRHCRWSDVLTESVSNDRKSQKKQNKALPHERVKHQTLQILSNPLSIGMKFLCAFTLCLLFAPPAGIARQRHCMFRVHAQANPRDTGVFATSIRAQVSGKDVAIEKIPRISEQDVIAFYPYPATNGTYGALFQLDEHGRIALDALSIERRGSALFVFINGRPITELEIDKRVSDGKIYIASGLTATDIDLMKKDWRLIGQRKR